MKRLLITNLTKTGFTETYTPLLESISSLHDNRKVQHISKHIAEGKLNLEPDVSYFESTENARNCVIIISTIEPITEILIQHWTAQQQPFRAALSIDLHSFVPEETLSLDYLYNSNKATLRYVAVVFDITAYENEALSVCVHTCFPMSSMPLSYVLISEITNRADSRLLYYVKEDDQLRKASPYNTRHSSSANLNHNIFSPTLRYLGQKAIKLHSKNNQLLTHLSSLNKALQRQQEAFNALIQKLKKNQLALGDKYSHLALDLEDLDCLKGSLLEQINTLRAEMIAYFNDEFGPVLNDVARNNMIKELEETESGSYTLSLSDDYTVTIDNIDHFMELLKKNNQDELKVIALSDLSRFSSYEQVAETLDLLETCIETIKAYHTIQDKGNQQTLNCQLAVLKVLSEPVGAATSLKNSSVDSSLSKHELVLVEGPKKKNDAQEGFIYLLNPSPGLIKYFIKGMPKSRSITITRVKGVFDAETIKNTPNKKMIINLINQDRLSLYTPPAVEQLLQIQTLELPDALRSLQDHLNEHEKSYELAQQLDALFFTDEINLIVTQLTVALEEVCFQIETDQSLITALREKTFKHFHINEERDNWLPPFLNDFSLLNYEDLFELVDDIQEICNFFQSYAEHIDNYEAHQRLLRTAITKSDQLRSFKADYPYAFGACDDPKFNMDLIINNLLYKLKFHYTFFASDKTQKLGSLNYYMSFHLEQTQLYQKMYAPWPVVMTRLKHLNQIELNQKASSPVGTPELSDYLSRYR